MKIQNLQIGLKTLALAAGFALAGCMTSSPDQNAETQAQNAEKLKFSSLTAESAVRSANIQIGPQDPEAFAEQLRQFGCPNLAELFVDLTQNTGNGLPASVTRHLSCFGISGSGTVEDVDAITEKLQDFRGLLGCICGGSALANSYDRLKLSTFSGDLSAAATAAFEGKSAAAAAAFEGKSSAAGSGFEGTSSAGASGFGD